LQIRKWEDKNGNKRNSAEIVVDNVYFADSKKDAGEKYEAAMSNHTQDYAVVDGDDGDLPF
jgi:single-strand DNA-binding protein